MRDELLTLVVGGAIVAIIIGTHDRQFPELDQFVQHPAFLIVVWLLLCSVFIRRWRILQRSPQVAPIETGIV